MFVHNIDPVLFSLGPLSIRYYGVIYALGFLLAYSAVRRAVKNKELPLSIDDIDAYMLWLIVAVVIGARFAEVIFYNPSYYFTHPLEIPALWHGGLSFHGGLVGALLATFFVAKKKRISFLHLADILSLPAALALALGRSANFINGELYGTPTNLPWAVKFPGDPEFRHPSQLYEAAKNLLIFFILRAVKKPHLQQGIIFGLFLTLYGIMRFGLEFVKEPEATLGPLTMGQVLSIPMIVGGMWLLAKKSRTSKSGA